MNKKLIVLTFAIFTAKGEMSATELSPDSMVSPPAVLVSSNGTLSPVSGSPISAKYASINFVAINSSGAGIIGGYYGSPSGVPYAAMMAPNGTLTQITGFPTSVNTLISGLAINDSGVGIISVVQHDPNSSPYAALVSPSGTLTQLSGAGFPPVQSMIECAAINNSGTGLIGGSAHEGTSPAYAALISSDGTVNRLSGGGLPEISGAILSAAINDHGKGIIGGYSRSANQLAYAGFVDVNGTVTSISGGSFPSSDGRINCVAINNYGVGLIGGERNPWSGGAYAALVAADGTITELTGVRFPSTFGLINSVAISDSGIGLIGGQDLTGHKPAYAALVNADGTLTELSGYGFPSKSGVIQCVAINSSGAGIIGGVNLTGIQPYYLSLVASDGTLTPLRGGHIPAVSSIQSVAINDAGVALVGWSGALYANTTQFALVAPNGTMTELLENQFLSLESVMMPSSIGSTLNAIYTQLAGALALNQHLSTRTRIPFEGSPEQPLSLLVGDLPQNSCLHQTEKEERTVSFWAAPFGKYVHQKGYQKNPSLINEMGGILFAVDYQKANFLFGGALGYAYNYIHFGSQLGHGHIQEEMVSLYASFDRDYFRVNAAAWGGLYQLDNTRHALSPFNSKAHTHGWLLSPHIEMATPISFTDSKTCLIVEPFALFDWVNNWQSQFTEKGKSGFNLILQDQYISLLRSEIGFRFYENICFAKSSLLLEQKLSYVNQAPFIPSSVSTAFVASASAFPIAIGSPQIQNLGGAELRGTFLPKDNSYPYVTLDLQGEFGPFFQSYSINLEIGKNF